ncbi:thioredoxin domain-containing protein [bacterium]|nr:thioredoxin domain-containing protein [bacterium]
MNIKEEIKEGRVLVDFYADWCGPCKMLGKQLEKYQEEVTEVKVVKINVEEEQELSSVFGVRSIPSLFYMENGEVVESAVGNQTIDSLKELTKIK